MLSLHRRFILKVLYRRTEHTTTYLITADHHVRDSSKLVFFVVRVIGLRKIHRRLRKTGATKAWVRDFQASSRWRGWGACGAYRANMRYLHGDLWARRGARSTSLPPYVSRKVRRCYSMPCNKTESLALIFCRLPKDIHWHLGRFLYLNCWKFATLQSSVAFCASWSSNCFVTRAMKANTCETPGSDIGDEL